jgi:hypothetical protein
MEPEKGEASESLQASGSHDALSRWGPTDVVADISKWWNYVPCCSPLASG